MHQSTPYGDQERLLKEVRGQGFFADYWDFLKTSGKWWMLPLLVIFLVLGVLLVLANTVAAPFIYTLF
jgi:hypothetical protein